MKWVVESERILECLGRHDWWARHPKQLREVVPPRAEALAEGEGKGTVYQQHVLRAAADVAEEINNEIWRRRRGEVPGRLNERAELLTAIARCPVVEKCIANPSPTHNCGEIV